MVRTGLVRELSVYTGWANRRVLEGCLRLSEEQLDQVFEMGHGSLRQTLKHIWGAERVWLDRVQRHPAPRFDFDGPGLPAHIAAESDALADERLAYIEGATDGDLAREVTFAGRNGHTRSFPVGTILLHVGNHGMHHRAQAVNMLRRLGVPFHLPGFDYIFMKLGEAGGGTAALKAPRMEVESLRAFFAYGDWAQDWVLTLAEKLPDEKLDRTFEIGVGSIRETLAHIRFAEKWWLENWTKGPSQEFPETPPKTPALELRRLTRETAEGRDRFLETLADADMSRVVKAMPRAGVVRAFPMGVTMLQICLHGTHHRAQLLNMLRHVGVAVPDLDVTIMAAERAAGKGS